MNEKSEFRDVLVLKRLFSAPIERVFTAWAKAEVLSRWFGPEGFVVTRATVNLSVGGAYDIEIQAPDGKLIRHFGQYIEINAPKKLVFTWMLEDQACQGSEGQCAETLVSIEFIQMGKATELTLTHERLPDQAALDGHAFGWNSSFDSLETLCLNDQ